MTADAKQSSFLSGAYPESYLHRPHKKPASQADMQAILEKRNQKVTNEPVQPASGVGVSPLVWLPKRDGESFIESECGRFTITGFREGSTLRYLAFVRSIPAGWPAERGEAKSRSQLGSYASPLEAKAACALKA